MLHRHSRSIAFFCILAIVFFLVGCSRMSSMVMSTEPSGSYVAPTVSSIFEIQPSTTPRPTHDTTIASSMFLPPTPNATAINQATIAALDVDQLKEVVVYDDSLASDWSLSQSFQTNINLYNKEYVYQGRYAIKVQPKFTTGTLYFTLNETAKQVFKRAQVLAVRFYLSGGAQPINNDTMTVAVIGSNKYSYWVKNDASVHIDGRTTDEQPLFSETRLFYLGVNTAIPSKTYVEVTNWLDSRAFDPLYTYLTGFYLKTDRDSVSTFYVDKVSVLLSPTVR